MDPVNFTIVLDDQIVQYSPIYPNSTIGMIKEHFRNLLVTKGRKVKDYTIVIYLNRQDKLDIDNTDKYDNTTLKSVWNNITDGYILLAPNYFSYLYGDLIYTLGLSVDLPSLTKLCQTDKRMSKLCSDDKFWMNRFRQDLGMIEKPDNISWKDFYKLKTRNYKVFTFPQYGNIKPLGIYENRLDFGGFEHISFDIEYFPRINNRNNKETNFLEIDTYGIPDNQLCEYIRGYNNLKVKNSSEYNMYIDRWNEDSSIDFNLFKIDGPLNRLDSALKMMYNSYLVDYMCMTKIFPNHSNKLPNPKIVYHDIYKALEEAQGGDFIDLSQYRGTGLIMINEVGGKLYIVNSGEPYFDYSYTVGPEFYKYYNSNPNRYDDFSEYIKDYIVGEDGWSVFPESSNRPQN